MSQSCTNIEEREERSELVIQDIIEVANKMEMEHVSDEDIERLLHAHVKDLISEDLQETENQTISEGVDSDTEEGMPKKICYEFLSITEIMGQFADNDPDYEWSSKVKRGVFSMMYMTLGQSKFEIP